jgi:two-component sensor histidine kinase
MSDGTAAKPHGALIDRLAGWASPVRGPAFRWGFAAAAVLVALATRRLLDPYLPPGMPYPTFVPVVLLTAFFAGTGPAAATAAACGLAAWFLFVPPLQSFRLGVPEAVALLHFAVASAIGILLVHVMRRALRLLAQAEARAKGYAEQRDLMFAELRHRVSNNLSLVGSLLALEREAIADPEARRALAGAAARLEVVSRLSRQLHDPEAREVDLGALLRALVPDALALRGAESRVGVDLEAEEVVVPASRAVPLGLVAAELLSNAVQHGFPSGQGGRIRVSLERTGASCARLLVRHDGEPLPPGFDLGQVRSPGLTVARQFARQLGAELLVTQDRGVVSCLSFPVRDPLGA